LIKQTLIELLGKENINVHNRSVFIKALELFVLHKIDFVDCILCSYNLVENVRIHTFDKKLEKLLK